MDLFILGGLLLLAIPVAFIWLIVLAFRNGPRLRRMEEQIAELKEKVALLETRGWTPAAPDVSAAESVEPEASVAEWLATQGGADVMPDEAAALPMTADIIVVPDLPPQPVPDGPIVMRRDRIAELAGWLAKNWAFSLAAASLAFAGIFLVRYGIEAGYLTPVMRVLGAVALGIALVLAGERMRRKAGDEAGLVPATFSGAGFVSIFAGVIAARSLYGLIGPEFALVLLAGTGLASVVIGWYHGPFLAAIGLIGATLAPFIVGGESDGATWLYAYFPLVAAIGLGIDTMRRWAWISVLALVLGYLGLWLTHLSQYAAVPAALAVAALAVLAATIPARSPMPATEGPMSLRALISGRPWPVFPARLAGGAMLASAVGLVMLTPLTGAETGIVFAVCTGLVLLVALWGGKARGLADLWLPPFAAFLVQMRAGFIFYGIVYERMTYVAEPGVEPKSVLLLWIVLGLAAAISLALAARSLRAAGDLLLWTLGGALTLPSALVVAHVWWAPDVVFGRGVWALAIMAAAAGMAGYAGALVRADAGRKRRSGIAAAVCAGLIGFAMVVVLSDTALVVGIAVLIVAAAVFDRRFDMLALALMAGAGVLALCWRLLTPEGLVRAIDSPLFDVVLSFGAAAAGCLVARLLLRSGGRWRAWVAIALEAGAGGFAVLTLNFVQLNVMADRAVDSRIFWSISLLALPWLVLALASGRLVSANSATDRHGILLVMIAGGLALLGLVLAVTLRNPLIQPVAIRGPLFLDTLTLAYAVPGLVILLAAWRARGMLHLFRLPLALIGVALVGLWVGLEIRRFWIGDVLSRPGVSQPELYSYTVAMILVGTGMLYQAIASGSTMLRRAAMGVIGLTAAKVFLIDATGLTGLMRVVSFLGLGLALSGLAWLNAWAAKRQGDVK